MRNPFFVFPFLFFLTIGNAFGQSQHCLADRYAQDALFDSSEIQITPDVHFATSMRWPSATMDSLRMDIYMPDPNIDPVQSRPLIVMTHGGAFLAGDRTDMAPYAMEMARRGFVTATISYRLGWNCSATDVFGPCISCQSEAWRLKAAAYRAVQDNRAAIRHLVHNAADLGIDTSYIFLQGESAGSITSLKSAFWDQSEGEAFCTTCLDDLGMLDTAGNDLTETFTIKGVINNCGGIANVNQGVMDGQDIPVIGFHTEWDCVVPYQSGSVLNCAPANCGAFFWVTGSDYIRARLNQNGICYNMNRYLANINHCDYPFGAIVGKSSCFLKSILCENCTSSVTDQIWDIPDCSAGGFVSIQEKEATKWVQLNGNRLIFEPEATITSIQVFDVSMRLLMSISANSSIVELPSTLRGCMFVRIDAENRTTEMLKWCNF
ncbi:MAG: carboxylesterase family protein [Flavobacteriales bacterium]|nr:carboxylesterase family protein [Flavobacteriales bacterium]